MELVLKYTGRTRPILSLPYAIGSLQAMVLEMLPPSILTLTQDHVYILSFMIYTLTNSIYSCFAGRTAKIGQHRQPFSISGGPLLRLQAIDRGALRLQTHLCA